MPLLDEDVYSDDDLICEIKNYAEGVEGDSQVQALDPSQLAFLPRALSSRGTSTFRGDVGHSTSGVASWDLGPRYACKD